MNKINSPWLGLIGLAIALSAALKALWEIPFWTTFWIVMALYLGGVVWKQVKDGVATAREGIQKAGGVVVGIVMFLLLQNGFSVIEKALRPAGETDPQLWFMWMSIATLISGGLAFAWIKEKRGMVIATLGITFTLLILQLGFPKYTAKWANRDETSATLETNGVLGASWKATWVFLFGKPAPEPPKVAPTSARQAETVEALVLMFEGYTPCSSFVGYHYKIRSDGYPLRVKFQNADWVEISGQGVGINASETFQPGKTLFESPDKMRPNVRVQVYRKVKINRP